MLLQAILRFISKGIFLILHVAGNSEFPPPLSKREEDELLEKWYVHKDKAAKDKLIEHNLRLVAHVVKKYNTLPAEQDDLISIGTIGLIKAVNSYTPNKKTRLSTFAAKCIENEILMHFRAKKKTAQDVFMSDPIDFDKEGNALTLAEVLSDDTDMVDSIDLKIKIRKLYKFIGESLSDRERTIIEYRYGLFGRPELTQREVAKKLGISRSYVSRIEKRALQLLYERFDGE